MAAPMAARAQEGPQLIGTWRTDPNDQWSLREYGDVSLRFEKDGTLFYTVHLPIKAQIMRLTYRVDGNRLVTDQPSSPREERTEFFFTSDGRLAVKNAAPAPPTFYVCLHSGQCSFCMS
jgi:hypothetical protein